MGDRHFDWCSYLVDQKAVGIDDFCYDPSAEQHDLCGLSRPINPKPA